ncbi:MAG: hypothetical protein Q4P11_03150 [Methanobrevibacter sp.]|nr:hypothetical protein [Methanobrevibacter sp.]
MVFGFLKRNKNKDVVIKVSTGEFWENCITTTKYASITNGELGALEDRREFQIPFEDIRRNFDDESYLRNVVKNQNDDLHHRTAALFYLFNFHNEYDLNAGEFFTQIWGEGLFEDDNDALNVRSDFFKLANIQDGAVLMMGEI